MCVVNQGHHEVEMGARMTRTFRNLNVEKRAEQVISKRKPSMAPKHPSTRSLLQEHLSQYPEIEEEVSRKNNKLLSLLRDVYVNSKDPVPVKAIEPQQEPKEFTLTRISWTVPKARSLLQKQLTLLNNRKLSPETWTAEKITQEYHLELKDVNSVLKHFITFEVKIISPEDRKAIQSK